VIRAIHLLGELLDAMAMPVVKLGIKMRFYRRDVQQKKLPHTEEACGRVQ
jgi:hypothetical protein